MPLSGHSALLQPFDNEASINETHSSEQVPWLRDHLLQALRTEATAAVVKTLRLLMDLIIHSGANMINFRYRVKADCGGAEGVLVKASR